MKQPIFIFCFLLICAATQDICEIIPQEPNTNKQLLEFSQNNQEYSTTDTDKTFLEAENFCRNQDYQLWSPTKHEDLLNIYSKLNTLHSITSNAIWTNIQYDTTKKTFITQNTWNQKVAFFIGSVPIETLDTEPQKEDCIKLEKSIGTSHFRYTTASCDQKYPFICSRPNLKQSKNTCTTFVNKIKEILNNKHIPRLAVATIKAYTETKNPNIHLIISTFLDIITDKLFKQENTSTDPPTTTPIASTITGTVQTTPKSELTKATRKPPTWKTPQQQNTQQNSIQILRLKTKLSKLERSFKGLSNRTELLLEASKACESCYIFSNYIFLSLIIASVLYSTCMISVAIWWCNTNIKVSNRSNKRKPEPETQPRYNPTAPASSIEESHELLPIRQLPSPPNQRNKYRVQKLRKQEKAF